MVSQGRPDALNRLTTFQTVQEQSEAWVTNNSFQMFTTANLDFRFTDVSFLATAPSSGNRALFPLIFSDTFKCRDSYLRGVYMYSYSYSGSGYYGASVQLNNVVLENCWMEFNQGYAGTPYNFSLGIQNCLIRGSPLTW